MLKVFNCKILLGALEFLSQSRRHGGGWRLSPPNCIMKHYKSVEFLSNLRTKNF